ncbi:hypothetical protein VTI74DRAFT_10875 [Chaetomium olivicolor]
MHERAGRLRRRGSASLLMAPGLPTDGDEVAGGGAGAGGAPSVVMSTSIMLSSAFGCGARLETRCPGGAPEGARRGRVREGFLGDADDVGFLVLKKTQSSKCQESKRTKQESQRLGPEGSRLRGKKKKRLCRPAPHDSSRAIASVLLKAQEAPRP